MSETLYKYQSETSWMITYHDTCEVNFEDFLVGPKTQKIWKKKKKIFLTTPEMVKEFYGDLTKSIFIDRVTVVVEENEKSISLKLYTLSKGRTVGTPYFGISRKVHYLTFNKKHKNFYSGFQIRSKSKLKQSKIRVNNWSDILNTLSIFVPSINEVSLNVIDASNMNTKHGWSIVFLALNVFLSKLVGDEKLYVLKGLSDIQVLLFKFYMETNGIAIPNGYLKFMNIPISKLYLKKYKNLVNACMGQYMLNGKMVRVLLNEKERIHWGNLFYLYDLLGVDFLNSLNFNFNIDKSNLYFSPQHIDKIEGLSLTNSEKRNVVNILNEYINKKGSEEDNSMESKSIKIINDHLRFKVNLKKYNEHVKISAKNLSEFNEEHSQWSILLQSYKMGYVERTYSPMMKKKLEEPIIGQYINYYPVLLTNSNDYNEESNVQKNCVRTYIEHPNCFIISIREGNPKGDVRATIEFSYEKGKSPKNVQSLGRFNESLNTTWNYVIEEINNRVKKLNRVITTPTMKKTYKSGQVIMRQSFWDGKVLMWDNHVKFIRPYSFNFLDEF